MVGIPGGINSPLFEAFASANKYNMRLVAGRGNEFVGGKPTENDVLNTVYILDSAELPFYQVCVFCVCLCVCVVVCHHVGSVQQTDHHATSTKACPPHPSTIMCNYQAEQYHQFHNGIGASFPKQYTQDLKRVVKEQGRIVDTGCPEVYFF